MFTCPCRDSNFKRRVGHVATHAHLQAERRTVLPVSLTISGNVHNSQSQTPIKATHPIKVVFIRGSPVDLSDTDSMHLAWLHRPLCHPAARERALFLCRHVRCHCYGATVTVGWQVFCDTAVISIVTPLFSVDPPAGSQYQIRCQVPRLQIRGCSK